MEFHYPVMLKEVIAHLKIEPGKKYIDCTLGDGGYSLEILKQGGHVLALDLDPKATKRAFDRIKAAGLAQNFKFLVGNFKDIDSLAATAGFSTVDGIVYDLGYSSYQLEEGEKGMSFLKDEPLDMRLSPELGVTAADLVNVLSEDELTKLIFSLSDETMARKFAKAIVAHRSLKKIQTTKELANLLSSVASSGYEHGRINPATRTFQALRIAVNDEISNLEFSLPRAAHLLLPGGRMEVVSFHSLEDKVVKFFGQGAQLSMKALYKKPLTPTEEEVGDNNRSRSAKLRIFEKC